MQTIEAGTVQMIPRHLIDVPEQVRTKFNESSIKELAADIRRRGGLIQNLTVRPIGNRFQLAIGGRRFKAIEYLGDEIVPAIVANISDDELEEMQLAENIQREDLSASDVANSIAKMWKKHGSITEVARRCNKSRSWVCKRLALALDVGPLTTELLDANAKDVELLYAFATLEKADDRRASALLPDLLEKVKGRKDVQEELKIALGKKAEATPAAEEVVEDTNLDLFKDNTPTIATEGSYSLAASLQIALDALKAITNTRKDITPADKAHAMRKLAQDALAKIGAI